MNRLDQLLAAHPWMASGEARLILVNYYHNYREKTDSEEFESSIQAFSDHLCEMSEHYVRNVLSVAFENSTLSRKELLSLR